MQPYQGQQPGQQPGEHQQPGNQQHFVPRADVDYGAQYAPVDPRTQLAVGVGQFMAGVMGWMSAGVAITALIAWGLSMSADAMDLLYGSGLWWVAVFAPIPFVWIFASRLQSMSKPMALGMFFVYAAMIGVSLSYVPMIYDVGSIFGVFGVTSVMFGATALFGYVTKKDLSGWGRFLFMALIGLIVAWVVSFFIPGVYFYVAAIGVLIFAGLTAYDTQNIKQIYLVNGGQGNLAVYGALNLYINFINMFLFLLRLFGGRD